MKYAIKFSVPTIHTTLPNLGPHHNPTARIIDGKEEGYVWEIIPKQLHLYQDLNQAYCQIISLQPQFESVSFEIEEYDSGKNYKIS